MQTSKHTDHQTRANAIRALTMDAVQKPIQATRVRLWVWRILPKYSGCNF